MNELEPLMKEITRLFPSVKQSYDPSVLATGSWFLDLYHQNKEMVVEWKPGYGFACSSGENISATCTSWQQVFREIASFFGLKGWRQCARDLLKGAEEDTLKRRAQHLALAFLQGRPYKSVEKNTQLANSMSAVCCYYCNQIYATNFAVKNIIAWQEGYAEIPASWYKTYTTWRGTVIKSTEFIDEAKKAKYAEVKAAFLAWCRKDDR